MQRDWGFHRLILAQYSLILLVDILSCARWLPQRLARVIVAAANTMTCLTAARFSDWASTLLHRLLALAIHSSLRRSAVPRLARVRQRQGHGFRIIRPSPRMVFPARTSTSLSLRHPRQSVRLRRPHRDSLRLQSLASFLLPGQPCHPPQPTTSSGHRSRRSSFKRISAAKRSIRPNRPQRARGRITSGTSETTRNIGMRSRPRSARRILTGFGCLRTPSRRQKSFFSLNMRCPGLRYVISSQCVN